MEWELADAKEARAQESWRRTGCAERDARCARNEAHYEKSWDELLGQTDRGITPSWENSGDEAKEEGRHRRTRPARQ